MQKIKTNAKNTRNIKTGLDQMKFYNIRLVIKIRIKK